ncbi:Tfp assembly type protein [Sporosarcina sp. P13]|uniref:type IV pilin protein n=1 Tax=Sporosarcina sp. P13 TaxID=2048263 RepID=UPI000C171141|nr:prepilin-type N-terminal cleavage/methylation domain-containing protein [Sporosarcina sp. P13]PIC63851.1 Tfp assembly type protein [Sporosarcina sp. P13]
MKKFLKKKLNQKGLTLVELLAVIVILGIISAIAVPSIGNIITNSKVNALKADGQNVLSAAQMYFAETGGTANVDGDKVVTQQQLIEGGFLEDAGGLTGATVKKADTGNTISGTATTKGVTVVFKDATSRDITDADVKATDTTATGVKVKVTR